MNKEEKKATRQSYGEELANLGEKNNKVVVLDADLSAATKTSIFAKKFPDRFFDMGIAEQNMIGTAAGLATCGKIPFASTFAMFAAGRAYDQIRNSICYPKLNVKICATHAGITVGEDGATHQMIEDISLMRTIPNMTVICTSDDTQTRWAVNEIAKFEGPVYLRLCRLATPKIYEDERSPNRRRNRCYNNSYRSCSIRSYRSNGRIKKYGDKCTSYRYAYNKANRQGYHYKSGKRNKETYNCRRP